MLFVFDRLSNRTKEIRSLEPYIHSFKRASAKENDCLSVDNFCKLFEDTTVRTNERTREKNKHFHVIFDLVST